MAMPDFTMRQLIEAGVHFGHKTGRWNPRMSEYIYGDRDGTHIIDLTQTAPMFRAALQFVRDTVAGGGRVLFVGTKRQARRPIAETAETGAQYYMNNRWLGGTLTNWKTVSKSIKRLDRIDRTLEKGAEGMTKKERLGLEREQASLQANLGGIRQLTGVPDILFVIDVKKEALAVAEAKKLGIPIVAIVDTNCVPDGIDYVIPGNDDGARAIAFYCRLMLEATLDGMSAQLGSAGVDLGGQEGPPAQAEDEGAAKETGSDGAKPDGDATTAVKVTRTRKSGLGREVAKNVAAKIAAASAKVMGGGDAAEGAKPESAGAAPAGETAADSASTGADSGDAPKPDGATPGAGTDSADAAPVDEKAVDAQAPAAEAAASDAPKQDGAKPDAAADAAAGAGADSGDAAPADAKAADAEAPAAEAADNDAPKPDDAKPDAAADAAAETTPDAANDAGSAADADATGGESGDSAEKAESEAKDDAKT